jgi:hypothetical protein
LFSPGWAQEWAQNHAFVSPWKTEEPCFQSLS